MNLTKAIRAASPRAPQAAVDALLQLDPDTPALATDLRAAHMLGQCAHESAGFTRLVENLRYSAERLQEVWPGRFPNLFAAKPFAYDAEALAGEVYGDRMGNTDDGDGYRFRGRGYLQLTGRNNYHRYSKLIGVDLVAKPDRAAEPVIAWQIAAAYLDNSYRDDTSALDWADQDNVDMVTRIVNGGFNGIDDRRSRTAAALMALQGEQRTLRRGDKGADVVALQTALARHGQAVGALDGDFGPTTERALKAFQKAHDIDGRGVAGPKTWAALDSYSRNANE